MFRYMSGHAFSRAISVISEPKHYSCQEILSIYFEFYRHYCFLTCKKDFEDSFAAHHNEQTTRIHALILQATLGDFERASFTRHSSRQNWSPESAHDIAVHHSGLTGMKISTAEYNCLKEFCSMEDFGYEYHNVKTDDNTVHSVGVGREGLRFCDETGSVIRR